jgi:NADH dehydrogenase
MSGNETRIVVLGGGFGGAYAAQALEKKLKGRPVSITLVDPRNFFVFYPLLVEAGIGTLEPRHTVVGIRSFLKRARFLMGAATGLDRERREVLVSRVDGTTERVPYDHLIIALGSVTRVPDNVPGLREHGFDIKTLQDTVALRDRAIQLLERAEAAETEAERRALLHFVVVGGNFTGAEVAGEYDAFLKAAARGYSRVSPRDCRVTLVELSDRILGALGDADLSAYATRKMRARGVDVRLASRVSSLDGRTVVLADGTVLDAHTVIWCAGIAPHPLLASLGLPRDERGYLLCSEDLRVHGEQSIWGIGDCAVNRDPAGNAYPATAQHAVRQAEDVAANVRRVLDGKEPRPHVFRTVGSLAALGCRTGVARIFGFKLSGVAAWFMWRTIYLLKMPGWSRKARVALDWTLGLFFGAEHVTLGLARPRDGELPSPEPAAAAAESREVVR